MQGMIDYTFERQSDCDEHWCQQHVVDVDFEDQHSVKMVVKINDILIIHEIIIIM